MDTPVYKLYLAKMSLDAFMLSSERKAEFLQKNEQIMKDTGGRSLVAGTVFSDERYRMFGVEMFPNWKALHEHDRCLDELGWFQYLQSETYTGVDDEQTPVSLTPPSLDPGVDYLAHVFIARMLPQFYDIPESEMAQAMAFLEHEKELGVVSLLAVDTKPVNEQWNLFGVELYPSMEVLVQKTREQEKVKWWKYVQACSYLAVPESGELYKK